MPSHCTMQDASEASMPHLKDLKSQDDPLTSRTSESTPRTVLPSFASIRKLQPSDYLDVASHQWFPAVGRQVAVCGKSSGKPQALPSVMSLSPAAMSMKASHHEDSLSSASSQAALAHSWQHLFGSGPMETSVEDHSIVSSISYKTMPAFSEHRPPSLPSSEPACIDNCFAEVDQLPQLVYNFPNSEGKTEWSDAPKECSTVNVLCDNPPGDVLLTHLTGKDSSSLLETDYGTNPMQTVSSVSAAAQKQNQSIPFDSPDKSKLFSPHVSAPPLDASASTFLDACDPLSSGISSVKHTSCFPGYSQHTAELTSSQQVSASPCDRPLASQHDPTSLAQSSSHTPELMSSGLLCAPLELSSSIPRPMSQPSSHILEFSSSLVSGSQEQSSHLPRPMSQPSMHTLDFSSSCLVSGSQPGADKMLSKQQNQQTYPLPRPMSQPNPHASTVSDSAVWSVSQELASPLSRSATSELTGSQIWSASREQPSALPKLPSQANHQSPELVSAALWSASQEQLSPLPRPMSQPILQTHEFTEPASSLSPICQPNEPFPNTMNSRLLSALLEHSLSSPRLSHSNHLGVDFLSSGSVSVPFDQSSASHGLSSEHSKFRPVVRSSVLESSSQSATLAPSGLAAPGQHLPRGLGCGAELGIGLPPVSQMSNVDRDGCQDGATSCKTSHFEDERQQHQPVMKSKLVEPVPLQQPSTMYTGVQTEQLSQAGSLSKSHLLEVHPSFTGICGPVLKGPISDSGDSVYASTYDARVPVCPSETIQSTGKLHVPGEMIKLKCETVELNGKTAVSDLVRGDISSAADAKPAMSDEGPSAVCSVPFLSSNQTVEAGVHSDVTQMLHQSSLPVSTTMMVPTVQASRHPPAAGDKTSPIYTFTSTILASSSSSTPSPPPPVKLQEEDRYCITRLSAENVAKLLLEPQPVAAKQFGLPRSGQDMSSYPASSSPIVIPNMPDSGQEMPNVSSPELTPQQTCSRFKPNRVAPSFSPFSPFSNPVLNKPLTAQENRCLSSELLQALGLWTSTSTESPVKKENTPALIPASSATTACSSNEQYTTPGMLADRVMETIEKLSHSVEQSSLRQVNPATSMMLSYGQQPDQVKTTVTSKEQLKSNTSANEETWSEPGSSVVSKAANSANVFQHKLKLGEITVLPGVYTDSSSPPQTQHASTAGASVSESILSGHITEHVQADGDQTSKQVADSTQSEVSAVDCSQIKGVHNAPFVKETGEVNIKEEPIDSPPSGELHSCLDAADQLPSSSTHIQAVHPPTCIFTSSIGERTKSKRLCKYVDNLVSSAQRPSPLPSLYLKKGVKAKNNASQEVTAADTLTKPHKRKSLQVSQKSKPKLQISVVDKASKADTEKTLKIENIKSAWKQIESNGSKERHPGDNTSTVLCSGEKLKIAKPVLLLPVRYTLDIIHKCDMCKLVFPTLEQLQKHTPVHAKEKVFMCTFCSLTFESPAQLRIHMKVDHNVDDKMVAFECRFCTRQFPDQKRLNNHLKTHPGARLKSAAMKAHAAGMHMKKRKIILAKFPFMKGVDKGKTKLLSTTRNADDDTIVHQEIPITEKGHSVDSSEPLKRKSTEELDGDVNSDSDGDEKQPVLKLPHAASIPAGRKRHTCTICDKPFITPYKLKRHMAVHSKGKASIKTELKKEEETEYQCKHCCVVLTSAVRLNEHLKTHTSDVPFECSVCGKTYAKAAAFKYHMRTHQSEDQTLCQDTGELRSDAATSSDHVGKPTKRDKYQCQLCDRTFTESSGYRYHVKTHTGERPHQCPHCDKSYIDGSSLTVHLRKHSGDRPYSCPVCNKSFAARGHLKTHLKIHSGHKPYKCGICYKEFTLEPSLTIHMRVHTREMPYSCSICGKKFNQVGNMKRHELAHTGQTPYECEICHRQFTYSGTLKTHQRIHTGERPFNCPICNKTFNRSGHVTRHIRVHSGEKPYKCKQCSKAYTQSGDLKRHVNTVHRPASDQHQAIGGD